MASKRTSSDSTKNLQVPSTKRIKHDDDDDDGNKEQRQHPLFRGLIFNGRGGLQLCFKNNLPKRNFTYSEIKAEGGEPLRIELRDAENQHIVRGPRLKGDIVIKLKDGTAYINNVEITDISKRRTEEFRLGAKIVRSNSIESDIREGRSEPFRVLNVRGKAYQKHYPPCLNDEVWRLEKIAKNGEFHKRLSNHGIHTVMDLLKLLIINESSLHKMFGKIPNKSWLAIIEHAKKCVADDYMLYSYVENGQQIALIFNAIYKLVGVTNDAQNYYIPDTLTPNLQNIVEIVKRDAYKNVDNNLVPIDEAQLNSISLAACLKSAAQSDAPVQGLHIDIATPQGQKETGPSYVQPCNSTSYANQGMNNCHINVDNSVPNITEIPQNNDVEGEMCIEEILNIINNVPFDFSDVVECSTRVNFVNSGTDISNNGKPKAVWCKIRAVIKWGISVRKVAAAKRNY